MSDILPKTLYLIDGYAAIFRAYYAIRRPLYSPVTGEATQAVLVFTQLLLKLFKTLQPDYVAVALDAPGKSFRNALYSQYTPVVEPEPSLESSHDSGEPVAATEEVPEPPPAPGYKGKRRATPSALFDQVPRILELLDLLGIPVISHPGLEADDVIATIAEKIAHSPNHADVAVRIVSPDKDFEQLVTEDNRVSVMDINTGTELDAQGVNQKRGVSPGQVVDLLALTGDTVDNIPGVPGIGPRTAAKLLQRYGSLDGIQENLEQIEERWRGELEKAFAVQLPLSRRLITLERDADVAFDLEQARVRDLPHEDLIRFFEELGFTRLKAQIQRGS